MLLRSRASQLLACPRSAPALSDSHAMTTAPPWPTAAFPVSTRRREAGRIRGNAPVRGDSIAGLGPIRRQTRPRSPEPRKSGNTLDSKELANNQTTGKTSMTFVLTASFASGGDCNPECCEGFEQQSVDRDEHWGDGGSPLDNHILSIEEANNLKENKEPQKPHEIRLPPTTLPARPRR